MRLNWIWIHEFHLKLHFIPLKSTLKCQCPVSDMALNAFDSKQFKEIRGTKMERFYNTCSESKTSTFPKLSRKYLGHMSRKMQSIYCDNHTSEQLEGCVKGGDQKKHFNELYLWISYGFNMEVVPRVVQHRQSLVYAISDV